MAKVLVLLAFAAIRPADRNDANHARPHIEMAHDEDAPVYAHTQQKETLFANLELPLIQWTFKGLGVMQLPESAGVSPANGLHGCNRPMRAGMSALLGHLDPACAGMTGSGRTRRSQGIIDADLRNRQPPLDRADVSHRLKSSRGALPPEHARPVSRNTNDWW